VSSPPLAPAAWRRTAAVTWWDLRSVLGNGEQLIVMAVIPVGLLLAIALTGTPDLSPLPQGSGALAAAVAVATVSSAFTGQAIAVAFDRRSGLLRFFIATPAGRRGVVAGRLLSVVVLVLGQLVVLLCAALAIRVEVSWSIAAALAVTVIAGTAAFAALGLLLGGTARAEAVLAVANLAWLLMVAGGGLVLPPDRLPLADLVALTPPGLLGEAARVAAAEGRIDPGRCVALLLWAVPLGVAAARLLRWR
jgi:ABC-2 type transport system permease protein